MFEHETRMQKRTFAVLVENEPGVLARIAGLFSARGFNIQSLAVGETNDPTMSRMTIVVEGTSSVLEQVNKQLNKLIPVISVLAIHEDEMISQELTLIKLEAHPEITKFVEEHGKEGKIVILHKDAKCVVLRVVADLDEEPEILKSLKKFKIVELCRTGEVAVSKKRTFGFLEKEQKSA